MVMEDIMIPITHGVGEAIMDMDMDMAPTGQDTTTDGMPDITMDREAIILSQAIAIDMVILTADIPLDIPTEPGRPQALPRDPVPVIPGTEAVPVHQPNLQLHHVPIPGIPIPLPRGSRCGVQLKTPIRLVQPMQFKGQHGPPAMLLHNETQR